MFKLKVTALCAILVFFFVSCASTPDTQDDGTQNTKNAQSAQKARDAANRAFMNETGDGVGDEDIPDSLPSSSASENDAAVSGSNSSNPVDDYSSISSFDEPSVVFSLPDTVQGKQPEWVKSPQRLFPPSQYLSAVGMGKNTADAENSAIASIGKVINQNVSSKIVTTEKDAVSTSGFTSSSSTLDEIIEIYSVVDALVGVKIHEFWWGDDGYVYALAYLNKAEAAQYYMKKISENESLAAQSLLFARERKGSFDAFAAVQTAVRAAEENNQYMDILNAVQPSEYRAKQLSYGNVENVKKAAYEIAMTISIDVSVQGTDDSRISSAIMLMLSKYGFMAKLAEEGSTASYIIDADVEFMDVPSERNKYVRYVFNADLKEAASGKILLPYSENKREGHTSVSEAQQRAIRTLEKSILENYSKAFVNYLRVGQ